jgi:predicted nucleic acid-binding protein
MPAKAFVDSNIWLYALIQSDDSRHRKANDFLQHMELPIINSQVIREVCSNLKKKTSISEVHLRFLIRGWYQNCQVVHSNENQHEIASLYRESYSFSYWDSLIIAAAIDSGCTKLFSEDMQHGQQIGSKLTIINPFIKP